MEEMIIMSAAQNDTVSPMLDAEAEIENLAQEALKPEFQLQISADKMTAYLRVTPAYAGQSVSYDDVIAYLAENKITYGICENEIKTFCEAGKFYSELICAVGEPCQDETNGNIEYLFERDSDLKPKEREDGTVDFRDLGLVKNVTKGEVLCRVILPIPGKDGKNIFNEIVHHIKGKIPALPYGTNTVVSEDGLSLLAETDGCIEFTKTNVNVNEVFVVHGDVDSASGNINAIGSVIIQGDVREGFFVKAGKDITIRGMVEGAAIEAKGSISISKGMSGMGKGILRAGENIVGKYFENASIFTQHDLYADVLMNCRAVVGDSIIMKGAKALIIGGMYQAGKKIYAKTIGSSSRTITSVIISSKELTSMLASNKEEESQAELESKLSKATAALETFQQQFAVLAKQLSGQDDAQKSNMLIKAALIKKNRLSREVEDLKSKLKTVSELKNSLVDYKIIGTRIIYSGTKITIGPHIMNLNDDYSNSKFYAVSQNIVIAPILSSDTL
jgi:uncharacterized protein (DUF342 family)